MTQAPGAAPGGGRRDAAAGDEPVAVRTAGFDPLGPAVRTALVASGRTVHFVDDGPDDGVALLFLGGAGTSVRAVRLLEFARSFRAELGIRIISVERNGLGQTPFDPGIGPQEHAADVWSLLDARGVGSASVVAISGGGPYAAVIAATRPDRVRSLHIACALAEPEPGSAPRFDFEAVAADPVSWWEFPPSSTVHAIPGFQDSAVEEATRSAFAKGRDVPQDGLQHAFGLYASFRMPSLAGLTAPAFLYWGSEDALVPTSQMARWRSALARDGEEDIGAAHGGEGREEARGVVERLYPGEGHDVQYRHWDQILADVAFLGERVVASRGGATWLLPAAGHSRIAEVGWTLGLAGWNG